jgi:hypothetical protein
MNPTDFILVLMSLSCATISIVAQGWTLNGVGPALLATAGGFWQLWMQWVRHRSWVQHRDSGFAPGTQHLALSAAVGWFLGTVGAMTWVIMAWRR